MDVESTGTLVEAVAPEVVDVTRLVVVTEVLCSDREPGDGSSFSEEQAARTRAMTSAALTVWSRCSSPHHERAVSR
jgi:hypothetical protein